MAGVGQNQLAVGAEPGGLAGGEAFAAGEDAVEGFEDLGGAALRGAAQRAHQHGDVHGGLQALAGHVADDHQQAAVGRRLHVEEVAAHLVGGVVDGINFEARGFLSFSRGIISSCTLRAAASSLEARSWSR